ncbi:MAG: twin-arginine translocation signal domain-containing protein [Acidimicrobiia bacterium]
MATTDGSDEQPDFSRRDALKRLGAAAGVAWSAPVVMSFFSPASAQTGTPPPPTTPTSEPEIECMGAACGQEVFCSSQNDDCICVATTDGLGLCAPGSLVCNDLLTCSDGECPGGSTCAPDTCCGEPKCIPLDQVEQCPPNAFAVSGRGNGRVSTGPGTIGP